MTERSSRGEIETLCFEAVELSTVEGAAIREHLLDVCQRKRFAV